jgi:hypothetical protein
MHRSALAMRSKSSNRTCAGDASADPSGWVSSASTSMSSFAASAASRAARTI